MTKILLLSFISIWSTGCTFIGFYSGVLIDKSNYYTIDNPTYDSLKIEIGTPITVHLLSDDIINGRFSKVVILTDSLPPNWNIFLHSHDNYVEVSKDSINSIDVKPYSYTVLLTTGLGVFLDMVAFAALLTMNPGG